MFCVGTSMGTWLGRITCVNYYRRAIGFKATMDWMGTYVKTQTYNVESKIFIRNIFPQKCFYYKCNKKAECSTVIFGNLFTEDTC